MLGHQNLVQGQAEDNEAPANTQEQAEGALRHRQAADPTRILVSSSRKPVAYINLCKRILREHGEIRLTALGIAMSACVTVAEILKARDLAVEKSVGTCLENLVDNNGRSREKPKMEVVLVKSDEFDDVVAAEAEELALTGRLQADTECAEATHDAA